MESIKKSWLKRRVVIILFSEYLSEKDSRRHCDQHASRYGKAFQPWQVLLFLQPDKAGHCDTADACDQKRDEASLKLKSSLTRYESSHVASDIGADKSDEHGGHCYIAKTLQLRGLIFFLIPAADLL